MEPETPAVLQVSVEEFDRIIEEDRFWEAVQDDCGQDNVEEEENIALTEMRFRTPFPLDLKEHLKFRLELLCDYVADQLQDWDRLRIYVDQHADLYSTVFKQDYGRRSAGFGYFLRQFTRIEIELFAKQGQRSRALHCAKRSFALHRKLHGLQHQDTVISLSELGEAYYLSGKYDKAARFQQMALSQCQSLKAAGRTHASELPVASIRLRLANSLLRRGRLGRALFWYYLARVDLKKSDAATISSCATEELQECRRQLRRCKLEYRLAYHADDNAHLPIWSFLFPKGW